MPFDSNGVFSLTPGYLAVTGETILPTNHNPPLEDIAAQGLSSVLVRDGRAPMIGNLNMGGFKATNLLAGTSATDAVNKSQLDAASSKYLLKSANYTAVVGDNTASIRFTVAATLSLATAASLGSGWKINVIAAGGAVTIDPNAAETINGLTTLVVPIGSTAEIICDGSNFFTVFKPMTWQTILHTDFSAVSGVDVTNLVGLTMLRLALFVTPSVNGSNVAIRTSTNNGVSFDNGAGNYINQSLIAVDTTLSGGTISATQLTFFGSGLTNTAPAFADMIIGGWTGGVAMRATTRGFGANSTANQFSSLHGGSRTSSTDRNAFTVFPVGGGTISGSLLLEGSA